MTTRYLQQCRQDRTTWELLSFSPVHNDERGDYDAHEQNRSQALIELQYDWQSVDYEFVRFLLEQEIKARETDSFQGSGALSRAAYLLARYSNPDDLPLFVRAKYANFDTACGFPWEYLFVACRELTEQELERRHPETFSFLRDQDADLSFPEWFDEWWNSLAEQFPDSPENEDLLGLVERAYEFEKYDEALDCLELWRQQAPDSEETWRQLRYWYAALDQFRQAAVLAERILATKEQMWDRVSITTSLLEYTRKAADYDESLQHARDLAFMMSQFDDWKGVGLGRSSITEIFELSFQHPNLDSAREVFELAADLFERSHDLALVGLQAAARAAERCRLENKQHEFEKLCRAERARIDAMLK